MSIFARRHYQFMADHIGSELRTADSMPNPNRGHYLIEYASHLIAAFQRENHAFKPSRFEAAIAKARGCPKDTPWDAGYKLGVSDA